VGSLVTRVDNTTVAESDDAERIRAKLLAGDKPTPDTIGRYRVLDEIGAGGMGVVFSAFDEELDRKIAIKVVHSEQASESARVRMRREAQALGRLAHPNVVTVHEIGEENDQIFIAMEFVRGQTLRAWCDGDSHDWREVLAVYLQAARGLAAAHDAGILHRDFKPDNALLGEDGRVRVLDFGLARGVSEAPEPATMRAETTVPPVDDNELNTPLTRTGSVLGTPTYMAAEQHLGEPTDARTDQFSFCVSLWEALFGERPFAGTTRMAIGANVTAGEREPAPRDSNVPAAIRIALERGLAVNPDDRHADMAALVATFERVLSPRRARWWIPATVLPVAGLIAFVATRPSSTPREHCPSAAERFEDVWSDTQRAALAEKFAGVPEHPYVAATWRSFERSMDAVAGEWAGAYQSACAATLSSDQDERRLATLRLSCLDVGLERLDALVDSIAELPAEEAARSYHGTVGMRALLTCTSDEIVRSTPGTPTDPDVAAQVASLRRQIIVASSRLESQPKVAVERAHDAAAQAREIGDRPLLAEALSVLATAKVRVQDPAAKEATLEALRAAETAGHDIVMFEKLLHLARMDDRPFERLDRASAILERLGSPARLQVVLMQVRVIAMSGHGKQAEAAEVAADLVARFGDDPQLPATVRSAVYAVLGTTLQQDPAASLKAARRAVQHIESEFGQGHPLANSAMDAAAFSLYMLGRFDESVAAYDALISVLADAHPEGHPRAGWALVQRGHGFAAAGRLSEAKASWQRARALLTELLGESHHDTIQGGTLPLFNVAVFDGDLAAARSLAPTLRSANLRSVHHGVLLACLDAADGSPERARATVSDGLERAAAGQDRQMTLVYAAYVEAVLGEFSAARAYTDKLTAVGMEQTQSRALKGWILVELGEYAAALPLLEDALDKMSPAVLPDVAPFSALARYSLAVALHETGGDNARAVRLATLAVEDAKVAEPLGTQVGDKAERWLADHGT